MLNDRWFRILFMVLVSIVIGQFVTLYGLPQIAWWSDVMLHFLGGAWLGGMAAWLLFTRFLHGKISSSALAYAVGVAVALGIGIGWEIFEIAAAPFIVHELGYLEDTLGDLVTDSVGGFAAVFLFLRLRKK